MPLGRACNRSVCYPLQRTPLLGGALRLGSKPLCAVAKYGTQFSAQVETDGKANLALPRPDGADCCHLNCAEMFRDADAPRFESDELGQGTDAENRTAMAKSVGMFSTRAIGIIGHTNEIKLTKFHLALERSFDQEPFLPPERGIHA